MRCRACDKELNDREATTKFLFSGTYADMCSACLISIQDDAPTEDSLLYMEYDDAHGPADH